MTKEHELERENRRLKEKNKTLTEMLRDAAVEMCMKCKCPTDDNWLVRENCVMCRYRFLKNGEMPP